MAYVPQTQDDEEKRRAEAGGGALGSFGSTQGAGAPTQPKFVNVADYLSKNMEGSANIANAASGKLEQQRDEAGNAVNESGTGFNNAVTAGTTNLDENLLGSALSKPEDFVKDPNNTAKFLAMRDAAYKGPMNLQNTEFFAPTQSKVTGLGTMATGLGTEEGRNALVSSLSDHPTQGKTSLNQLLLQGNPEAAQKIQDTAGTFKGVEDQWAQLLANAPSTADAAKAATDATRTTTQSRLGNTTNQFKTGINDKLTNATNDRNTFNTRYTDLNNRLNSSATGSGINLSELDLKDLGIEGSYPYLSKLNSFNQDLNRYGNPVPLSTYVSNQGSANTNIPTLGGVASPEDYARESALQQLSGQDLGLAETPETPYTANGSLPSGVNYMEAFGQAGNTLHGDELNFLQNLPQQMPEQGANSADFYSKYYPATTHVPGQEWGATGGNAPSDYYTTPDSVSGSGITYQTAPPPPGFTGPAPYPTPTSNPPAGLVNPTWDPYNGVWNGVNLQPTSPPPTGGGGGYHTPGI